MNLMKHRLYLLLPDQKSAASVVEQLSDLGIKNRHIHTIAKPGIDISELPEASVYQKNDTAFHIEQWLWAANLTIFFVATAVFFASLLSGELTPLLVGLLFMGLTYSAGYYFATHVPHVHLQTFQAELKHGEILLLVDVPHWRIATIESVLKQQHPELITGGVGWTIEALHL